MARTSNDKPISQVLVEGDLRVLSDVPRDAVVDLIQMAELVEAFGYDANGQPRLRGTATILDEYVARMPSVDGKRAKQLAEVLKHEHFEKKRNDPSWDPDHRLYETQDREPPTGGD